MLTIALSLLGLLVCAASIAALALLLNWREQAASAPERARRFLLVLPGAMLLLAALLWTLLHIMLLWAPSAAPVVAVR